MASRGAMQGSRARSGRRRNPAALLPVGLVLAAGAAGLAWVGGPWRRGSSHLGGVRRRAAADELEEDIVLLPMDSDEADFFKADDETGTEQPMDGFPDAGLTPAQRKKMGIPSVINPDEQMADVAALPELPPAPSKDLPSLPKAPMAKDDAAPAKKKPKRWLAGRGSAKRKKLEQNAALEDWLRSNGVHVSDRPDWGIPASSVSMAIETRELVENEISGRGLIASRDIDEYEELAKVPKKLIFCRDAARDHFGHSVLPEVINEYTSIALHLSAEKHRGKTSFWAPYIDILPTVEEVGSSWMWEEEELSQLLQGSPLWNMSMSIKNRVDAEFQRLQEGLFVQHPDKFPESVFTLERYRWAYSILFSRAARFSFKSRGQAGLEEDSEIVALVPYIDLINHSPTTQAYIAGLTEGLDLPGVVKEEYIIVKADKYYAKYEQVYLSYGPKSNSMLLLLYGFCLERNTADYLDVNLGELLKASPLAAAKERWLKAQEFPLNTYPLYRDRFTNDMMQFLRLVTLQPEDLNLPDLEDKTVDAALKKMDFSGAFGELSERRALLCLKGICENLQKAYPNTAEEDEALIQDRAMFELLPKNQRNAIRVRYAEKCILRNTINTLNRIMNNLGQLTEMKVERGRKRRKNRDTFWGRLGFEWDPVMKASNIEELMAELDV